MRIITWKPAPGWDSGGSRWFVADLAEHDLEKSESHSSQIACCLSPAGEIEFRDSSFGDSFDSHPFPPCAPAAWWSAATTAAIELGRGLWGEEWGRRMPCGRQVDEVAEQLRALGFNAKAASIDPGPPPSISINGVEIGTVHPTMWDGKLNFEFVRKEQAKRDLAMPRDITLAGPMRGVRCRVCRGKGFVDVTVSSHFDEATRNVRVETVVHWCPRCNGLGLEL